MEDEKKVDEVEEKKEDTKEPEPEVEKKPSEADKVLTEMVEKAFESEPKLEKDKKPDEEPEKEPDKKEDEPEAHSAMLIARALKANMSTTEAKEYDSETLEEILDSYEVSVEPEEKKPEEEEPEEEEFKLDLEDDDVDEKVAETLKALVGKINEQGKELSALKKSGTDATDAQKKAQAVKAGADFDNWCNSQGDEYKGILGEGTIRTISRKEAEQRNKLYGLADMLDEYYEQVGETVSKEDVRKTALAIRHGKIEAKKEDKSKLDKAKKRAEQAISTPAGSKKGDVKSAEDKTREFIKENWA
jgi:hypothetical protein